MPRKKKTDDAPAKKVAAKNYDKEIAKLMERGRKDGKLEQQEIFEHIPDVPGNIDVLEQLYAEMVEEDIDMIPVVDLTEDKVKAEADVWEAEEEEAEVAAPEVAVYMDDIADDSVRLYL